MDKSLFLAMSGARQNIDAQALHANNLANTNTNGFKADLERARSMPVFYGEGYPTRVFSMTETPATDFSPGSFIQTGRDLDVVVNGAGFIAVETTTGTEAYTRNGAFYVDSVGVLRTGNNLPVIGGGGPIVLPDFEKLEIGVDGTISVVVKGGAPEEIAAVDRIKLVNPDPQTLVKGPDGIFKTKQGEAVEADAAMRVTRGALESSNVNALGEMTSFLSLARQYELHIKIMRTAEENSEVSARLLQIS